MFIFIFFFLGLIVGSFLNVVISRLNTNEPIVWDRSECPKCHTKLGPADLVPLLSFAWLRGHCRHCGKNISWQYPIVELITGVTFGLFAYNLQPTTYNLAFEIVFACFLIVIAVYDYKHYLILDKVVFPAAAVALVYQIFAGNLLWAGFGVVVIAGFFGLQYVLSKGKWIGLGDVKLGIFLGLLFSKAAIWYLLFSYILGGLIAVALLVSGRKKLASKLPFGTILAISGIIFMLYGDLLLGWYLDLLRFK